jgi:hypothetical protein
VQKNSSLYTWQTSCIEKVTERTRLVSTGPHVGGRETGNELVGIFGMVFDGWFG